MPNAIGIPEEMLREAAKSAVCKINIDSDLRLAMTASIREHMALNPADFDPRQYLKPARAALKDMVTRLKMFWAATEKLKFKLIHQLKSRPEGRLLLPNSRFKVLRLRL